MRVVVDTNIVFSAILNVDSKIANILLHPKSRLNFYTTHQLFEEIQEHKEKIKNLGGYSDKELERIISIFSSKIRCIHVGLIPKEIFRKAEHLAKDVDIDDTEFIALTEHIKARFWSGDKRLIKGIKAKNWNKFISTDDLYLLFSKRK